MFACARSHLQVLPRHATLSVWIWCAPRFFDEIEFHAAIMDRPAAIMKRPCVIVHRPAIIVHRSSGLSYTTFELNCVLLLAGHGATLAGNRHAVECTVHNTGPVDGDEVVLVFHAAGEDVRRRIGTAHPVPTKALVGFERLRVAAGSSEQVRFELNETALELVDATGRRQLYAGSHQLQFSRGHGTDVVINVTVNGGKHADE